jgi:hypothetical protein
VTILRSAHVSAAAAFEQRLPIACGRKALFLFLPFHVVNTRSHESPWQNGGLVHFPARYLLLRQSAALPTSRIISRLEAKRPCRGRGEASVQPELEPVVDLRRFRRQGRKKGLPLAANLQPQVASRLRRDRIQAPPSRTKAAERGEIRPQSPRQTWRFAFTLC